MPIFRRKNCIHTASGIFALCKRLHSTPVESGLQFKRGVSSTCNAPRPGRPKTVTTPEIIDQIHELILEDPRISAKKPA